MAQHIANVGKNLELYKVHVDEIDEQDVNAQVMPPEMLERLTENIRKEGRLEQLPFAILRSKPAENGATSAIRFELVGGHHRIRAARTAGLTELYLLADTRDLSRSHVVAKQLAHNAIHGNPNKEILARLYNEMTEIDAIIESYVTPTDFDDVKALAPSTISDMQLAIEWRQFVLVFLPPTMDTLDKLDEWAKKVPKNSDAVGVVSNEVFARFRDAALAVSKVENVRSLGAVVARMVEIVEQWCKDNDVKLGADSEEPEANADASDKAAKKPKKKAA